MLTIKNLSAGYAGPLIVQEVNLEIHEGEIITIIGPNGAGKSTVIKSIFGLTEIKEGQIKYFTHELVGKKTSEIAHLAVSYVPQGRSIFPTMTVEENLGLGAYILNSAHKTKKGLAYVYQKFPRLHQRRSQKTKTLSGGEQQMVALGRALMLKPQLLLLDEPSIGLAPKIVAEVFEKIKEIKRDGTAVLMVEQNATAALEISDRGYVLELGRNKFEGKAQELLHDPRIREAYLGSSSV